MLNCLRLLGIHLSCLKFQQDKKRGKTAAGAQVPVSSIKASIFLADETSDVAEPLGKTGDVVERAGKIADVAERTGDGAPLDRESC